MRGGNKMIRIKREANTKQIRIYLGRNVVIRFQKSFRFFLHRSLFLDENSYSVAVGFVRISF